MLKVNLFLSECSEYQNRRLAEGEAQGGPGLLRALRRDPRPEPARHHPARPDVHGRAGPRRAPPAGGQERAGQAAAARARRRRGRRRAGTASRSPTKPSSARPRRSPSSWRRRSGSTCPTSRPAPAACRPAADARARRRRRSRHGRRPAAPRLPARAMRRALRRRQPRPHRRGHDPRDDRRRVPRLQREQRPAVRPDHDGQGALANGANLVKGNEVRSGGTRVGVVSDMRAGPARGRDRRARELTLKLDKDAGDVPRDSTLRIRPRSALGLKYVELTKGTSEDELPQRRRRPVRRRRRSRPSSTTSIEMFDEPTREAAQGNLRGFGDALAEPRRRPRPHARGAARASSARSSR